MTDLPDLTARAFDITHEHLFVLIADLVDSKLETMDDEEVFVQLRKLQVHLIRHFVSEEATMRRDHFPYYEAHKMQHDLFAAHIEAQMRNCPETPADRTEFVIDLAHYVRGWLMRHIETQDMSYHEFLNARAS